MEEQPKGLINQARPKYKTVSCSNSAKLIYIYIIVVGKTDQGKLDSFKFRGHIILISPSTLFACSTFQACLLKKKKTKQIKQTKKEKMEMSP